MDITGTVRIPAAGLRVWETLDHVDVIKQCIPACRELRKVSETGLAAKLQRSFGTLTMAMGSRLGQSGVAPIVKRLVRKAERQEEGQ